MPTPTDFDAASADARKAVIVGVVTTIVEPQPGAAQQIAALKVTFRDRGLSFRYFPHATCKEIKWQALREVVDPITMPDGTVQCCLRSRSRSS